MSMTWDGSLSVGIETIDDDHKKLIDIINAVGSDDDKTLEEVTALLDELLEYTRYHFTREEEMMAEKGYPKLEQHKKEHGAFIGKLHELAVMVDTDDAKRVRSEASLFLLRWLTNHIQHTDKAYVPCLKAAKD